MKIVFVYCPIPLQGKYNGIVSQCLTWADGLRNNGHDVYLASPWDTCDWSSFDIIHIFGSTDMWFYGFINELLLINHRIVWSPICDNIDKPCIQYAKSLLGIKEIGIFSLPYVRRLTYHLPILVCTRSEYEKNYISHSYHIPLSKIEVVPLSMTKSDAVVIGVKEDFCFHLSALFHPRKNVLRLVKAANKYGFRLVLAGSVGSDNEFKAIRDEIGDNKRIQVLGKITDQEKEFLYQRAKVFALPSISEGVGIVALDAAHYGCDIVITEIGGPKEYYGKYAECVNPYDIDDIGSKIMKSLSSTKQPMLKKHVDINYSIQSVLQRLEEMYCRRLCLNVRD